MKGETEVPLLASIPSPPPLSVFPWDFFSTPEIPWGTNEILDDGVGDPAVYFDGNLEELGNGDPVITRWDCADQQSSRFREKFHEKRHARVNRIRVPG